MTSPASLAEAAALIGDPARANMLDALMDGRALTATELAYAARISASTTSAHLAKLVGANLVSVVVQGRHRYFRIASPLVAQTLEGLMALAAIEGPRRYRPCSVRDDALALARTCYDHVAGRLGVALADALIADGSVRLAGEGITLTAVGRARLRELGLDLPSGNRRPVCRACLDWSERRMHLAGTLGAALAGHCLEQGWLARVRDTRALAITPTGREAFMTAFGVDVDGLADSARPPARRLACEAA